MTWHDSRFSQHTRFRYWLLDTSLGAMAPGIQHTFLKTNASCKGKLISGGFAGLSQTQELSGTDVHVHFEIARQRRREKSHAPKA